MSVLRLKYSCCTGILRLAAVIADPFWEDRLIYDQDIGKADPIVDNGRILWKFLEQMQSKEASILDFLCAKSARLYSKLIPEPVSRQLNLIGSITIETDEESASLPIELLTRGEEAGILCLTHPVGRLHQGLVREWKLSLCVRPIGTWRKPILLPRPFEYENGIKSPLDMETNLASACIPVVIHESLDFPPAMIQKPEGAIAPSLMILLACGDVDDFGAYAKAAIRVGVRHVITAAVKISREHAQELIEPLFKGLAGNMTIGRALCEARRRAIFKHQNPEIRALALSLLLHGNPDQAYVSGSVVHDPAKTVYECDRCRKAVIATNPLFVKKKCDECDAVETPEAVLQPKSTIELLKALTGNPDQAFMSSARDSREHFPLRAGHNHVSWQMRAGIQFTGLIRFKAGEREMTLRLKIGAKVEDPDIVASRFSSYATRGSESYVTCNDMGEVLWKTVFDKLKAGEILDKMAEQFRNGASAYEVNPFDSTAQEAADVLRDSGFKATASATVVEKPKGGVSEESTVSPTDSDENILDQMEKMHAGRDGEELIQWLRDTIPTQKYDMLLTKGEKTRKGGYDFLVNLPMPADSVEMLILLPSGIALPIGGLERVTNTDQWIPVKEDWMIPGQFFKRKETGMALLITIVNSSPFLDMCGGRGRAVDIKKLLVYTKNRYSRMMAGYAALLI